MEKKKDTFTDATRQKRKKYMVGDNKQTSLTWNILRQGYTRQLGCYSKVAGNTLHSGHRRYLLYKTSTT